MGTIVADASAIAAFIIEGSTETALHAFLSDPSDVHAPEICDVEILSTFRSLLRRRMVTTTQAQEALLHYAAMPMTRHPHLRLLGRGFDLRENVTASDAMYVALAEALEAPLLTIDRRLARAVGRHTSIRIVP
jgi:predicted nucleic acid-binding protein